MALLSLALVESLKKVKMVTELVVWSPAQCLGEWLAMHGIPEEAEVVTQFFGLPYRSLPVEARVTVANVTQAEEWPLYYAPLLQCYFCVRPPNSQERAAFHAQYGAQTLFLTDEVAIKSALLRGSLPMLGRGGGGLQRVYDVQLLLQQGLGHIDGMIGQILTDAIAGCATDVHLYTASNDFFIDFRIDGALVRYAALCQAQADSLFNKLKLMAEMDIAEHRLPQDGHIQLKLDEATYHLRLGTLPLLDGEKIVIRILPEQQRLQTLDILGFTREQCQTMECLLHQGQGMLLITGPTNSGKTTTLYACLNRLAEEGKLVYTIEDPVEAVLSQVQQSQVNVRSGYSFAEGLRGMLRSDPDVLVVGELRDKETVDIAARAALSGHLVVVTLHAFDAHQAVNRLRDLGLSDLLLSAVLLGVVNQRLLPRLCPTCGGQGTDESGSCCPRCLGSGRDGRTGVQEIWIPSETERSDIEQGMSSMDLRKQAMASGYCDLEAIARIKGVVL